MIGVVFDFDGLLADTEPIWGRSARLLLSRRGLDHDPELEQRSMGRHPLDVGRLFVERYGLDESPEQLARERLALQRDLYEQAEVPLMPGARELVAALSRLGAPLAVASSSPNELLEPCLGRLGLRESMRAVVGSDQVTRGKPAPDLFLLAAERLGLDPRSCAALEDSAAGVTAALSSGMFCVAVGRKGSGANLELESLFGLNALELLEMVRKRKVEDDR